MKYDCSISVRVERETKDLAAKALEAQGKTVSGEVNKMLTRYAKKWKEQQNE